jgi:hypothetical protein
MQGLAKQKAREKKGRRGSGKEEAGSPSSGPRGQRQHSGSGGPSSGARPLLSEEEFCTKFRLDRLARLRLSELPLSSRQRAMMEFNPGSQVPASDYPKVFVAFCKRFQKSKEDAGGDAVDPEADGFPSPSASRRKDSWNAGSPTSKSSKSKKKTSKSAREAPLSSLPLQRMPSAERADPGETFEAYPSPGCTPRSDLDDPAPASPPMRPMRQPMALGSPMSPPSSAVSSPQFARSPASPPRAPPPMYAPAAALGAATSLVPPPPMHAPLVYQDGAFEERLAPQSPQFLPPPARCSSGYAGYSNEQDEFLRGPPGQWTASRSGYSRIQAETMMFHQASPHNSHQASPHDGARYEVRGTVPCAGGWQVPVGSPYGPA